MNQTKHPFESFKPNFNGTYHLQARVIELPEVRMVMFPIIDKYTGEEIWLRRWCKGVVGSWRWDKPARQWQWWPATVKG